MAASKNVDASDLVEGRTLKELLETTNNDAIVTKVPVERFRLGYFSTACLIINRMIGTGIFNSPTTVIRGTKSTGGALLLWFFGMLYGLSGAHVYIEYGLNVPRYVIDGVEQAVPRSGADLHYIQFVYRWFYYKKDTILLSGCLYGISFICIGNMASNCLAFANRALEASNPAATPDNGQVRGIALLAAAFACLIHSVSRRGGIWLSNFLACVKVAILGLIIITTLVVVGGGIKDKDGATVPNVFINNTYWESAFQPPRNMTLGADNTNLESGNANGYAAAFLSIIFAYSGFDQTNYVLNEISRPRRTFPRATAFAVGLVSLLYMVVNICYMAVVPAFDQEHGDSYVALLFFRKIFGWVGNDNPDRIFNAFLALSSFGNIIVMTYTAARMKQEIAKQGFIPFAKFFGQNVDVSIGRFVLYLRERGWALKFFAAEQHQEPTPVGALVLHLASCVVLIFATYNIPTDDAYNLLSKLIAYLLTAWFGVFLAAGILILRIFGPPDTQPAQTQKYLDERAMVGAVTDEPLVRRTWSQMTGKSVNGVLSVVCATIYLVGNLFPVIASWIPITAKFDSLNKVSWWVVPTISWLVLAFAGIWWLGFLAVAKYREHYQQKRFVYEIRPMFDWAEPAGDGEPESSGRERRQRDGGKVLAHETVLLAWVGDEMDMFTSAVAPSSVSLEGHAPRVVKRQRAPESPVQEVDPFAGTDFDDFGLVMQSSPVASNTGGAPWRH